MQLSIEQLRSASVFTVMLLIASAGHVAGTRYLIKWESPTSSTDSTSAISGLLPSTRKCSPSPRWPSSPADWSSSTSSSPT